MSSAVYEVDVNINNLVVDPNGTIKGLGRGVMRSIKDGDTTEYNLTVQNGTLTAEKYNSTTSVRKPEAFSSTNPFDDDDDDEAATTATTTERRKADSNFPIFEHTSSSSRPADRSTLGRITHPLPRSAPPLLQPTSSQSGRRGGNRATKRRNKRQTKQTKSRNYKRGRTSRKKY
jgi:hypothetical protein